MSSNEEQSVKVQTFGLILNEVQLNEIKCNRVQPNRTQKSWPLNINHSRGGVMQEEIYSRSSLSLGNL